MEDAIRKVLRSVSDKRDEMRRSQFGETGKKVVVKLLDEEDVSGAILTDQALPEVVDESGIDVGDPTRWEDVDVIKRRVSLFECLDVLERVLFSAWKLEDDVLKVGCLESLVRVDDRHKIILHKND